MRAPLPVFAATAAALRGARARGDRPVTRYVFPDAVASHGARCLDGSPPGFYHRPGAGPDAAKFLIYSHGGSWCWDVDAADTSATTNCAVRATTYEGSSDHNPPAGPPRGNMGSGIMSPYCGTNPHFCNWTVVYFMYCDGSSWTGDRAEPHSGPNGTVWSRGRRNLAALYDKLLDPAGEFRLDAAEHVIVTGASAGGFMTTYHCDRIRALVPAAAALHCVPDAGFWPDFPAAWDWATRQTGQHLWRADMARMVDFHNATGGLDASCVAAHPGDAAHCAHPPNVLPHIAAPVFVSTSHVDTAAMADILAAGGAPPGWSDASRAAFDNCLGENYTCGGRPACSYGACDANSRPLVDAWAGNITALLAPARAGDKDGYFVNSCYRHHNIDGTEAFTTTVGGRSLVDTVAGWALGLGGATQVIDPSPPGGNPTC